MAAMRKVLTLVVAGLVLAGCGGGNLSSTDKQAADTFIDGKSQFERDALCEQLSTAEGRLEAKQSVEQELGAPTAEDMLVAGGAPSPEQQAAMDKVAKGLGEGRQLAERAEAIVGYIKNNKC